MSSKRRRVDDDDDDEEEEREDEEEEEEEWDESSAGAGAGVGVDADADEDDFGDDEEDDDEGGHIFMDDEAEEEEEFDEDDGEDLGEDEAGGMGGGAEPIARRSSKSQRKEHRRFSLAVIEQAIGMGWETEEIARLLAVMMRELDIARQSKFARMFQFLAQCSMGGDPTLLGRLQIELDLTLEPSQLGLLIHNQAMTDSGSDTNSNVTNRLMVLLEEACEQHLFQLNNADTVQTLYDLGKLTAELNNAEMKRLAVSLCSFAGSKKNCGKVLNVFVQDLPAAAAAIYVYECIQFDYFQDLRGRMVDLYAQVPEIRRELQEYIESNESVNQDGDIVDTDEDDDGNLIGFVVNSGDEGEEEEDEDGGGGPDGESTDDEEDV